MAEEVTGSQGSSLANEVDAALSMLESALTDARRAVDVIRASLSQIAGLERRVREMEAAMSRALESLSAPLEPGTRSAAVSQIRPIPIDDTREQEQASPSTAEPSAAPVSNCLRLTVQSKSGSLDLKAVDGAVNENPDVVDVALLDYDGRQAALKLWVNPSADATAVRDALMVSLRSQLGDDGSAEAFIDVDEAA